MWRQGDVLIQAMDTIPEGVGRLKRAVLASGDSTGHRHQIKDHRTARLYGLPGSSDGDLYLDVIADEATLVHPEHEPIVLPRGCYRVWRQREFTDIGYQTVID